MAFGKWFENKPSEDTTNEPQNKQLDNPNAKIADEVPNTSATTSIQKLPADIRINFPFELEKFPDRTYAVKLRNQNILKALALGNIGLANLSFAKMVESIRH